MMENENMNMAENEESGVMMPASESPAAETGTVPSENAMTYADANYADAKSQDEDGADEILAENKTVITEGLFHEAFELTFNKKAQNEIFGIGGFCTVAGIALLLMQLKTGQLNIFWIPFLCMGVFVIWWGMKLPKKKELTKFKAVKAGSDTRNILFYEDHMEIQVPGVKNVENKYSEMNRIIESENVMLLIMKDKSGVIVDKNGFSVGDADLVKKITGK